MGKARIPTDAEIAAVRARSAIENAREIRAEAVEVLADHRVLMLTLAGRGGAPGATVGIPLAVEPQLAALTPGDLAALRITPSGTTLTSEPANLDLSVEALVLRALMGPDYHQRLRAESAAALGSSTSEAKAAAARLNGAKGGRPRKAAMG